jgi:hypothetical protein
MALIGWKNKPESWVVAGWAFRQVLEDVRSQCPSDVEMVSQLELARDLKYRLLAHSLRAYLRCVPDPQLTLQLGQQSFEPAGVSAGFHAHAYLHSLGREITVELLRLLPVKQSPLSYFSCFCIHKRNLLKARMVVSNDSTIVEQLMSGVRQFAIAADVCPDLPSAATLIDTRKFEAIVVDLALGDQVKHVLERIRLSPSNGNSVTFAVVDSAPGADWKIQPNFVIPKPLDEKLVGSVLKAALGLIIRDYRRYFRCPLAVPVLIHIDGKVQIPCEMMNISEGGLAVATTVTFDPGAGVKAEFALPNEGAAFDIDAEICWCDKKGRAGVYFRSISADQKALIQDWLSRKIEQGIPEPIAWLFRKVV